MSTDFDALVLGPAMQTFACPVHIVPQDGSKQYDAQGVWRYQEMAGMFEDGTPFSTVTITLGIRLADWSRYPKVGDKISVETRPFNGPPVGDYKIDRSTPDGQGGVSLALKASTPVPVSG